MIHYKEANTDRMARDRLSEFRKGVKPARVDRDKLQRATRIDRLRRINGDHKKKT